jgi:hypothetical protein
VRSWFLPIVAVSLTACGATAGDSLYTTHLSPQGSGGRGHASGGVSSAARGRSGGASGQSAPEPGDTEGRDAGGIASGGAGSEDPDGGVPPPTGCDFSGTWATYMSVHVTWPQSPFVLVAGEGDLEQWNLSRQRQVGLDVEAETKPCSIFLPDLQSDVLAGYAKFGIRFPDSLFDGGKVPWVSFVFKGMTTATGMEFQTEPFATLLGVTLPNANSASWPDVPNLTLEDDDADGKVGITVVPATGQGYAFPPTDLTGGRADLIYIADRTIAALSTTNVDCDEVRGSVTIVPIGGKTGLNSTVVGCRKVGNVECAAADADFIETNRPQYEPSGPGTFTAVRVKDGAECRDVRARFPRP